MSGTVRLGLAATLVVVLAACSPGPPDPRPASTAGPLPEADVYDITDTPSVAEVDLMVTTTSMTVSDVSLPRYLYTVRGDDTVYGAGRPIVVDAGDTVRLSAANRTDTPTNIHWHGLHVPNDQDGPAILIEPGGSHEYEFRVDDPGTYWYHSHERPVRDQVDLGMYAPLIVREPADADYDRDQVLVLDDWLVRRNTGHMEIVGDVDTVNGRTGENIPAITIGTGQLHKLRLINASSARTQRLTFPVDVRVTHSDGRPLPEPFNTRSLTLAPAQRHDVELTVDGGQDHTLAITNDRDAGMVIPIEYTADQSAPTTASPFTPPTPQPIPAEVRDRDPDITMDLAEGMGMGMGMGRGMLWTINGAVFPDTGTFAVDRSTTYVVRFRNRSMHRMPHPMHIHGAHFRVLAVDGAPVATEAWRDTADVPPGATLDIALTFDEPGVWMVHCHILDHEDGGMMATFTVT